MILMSDLVHANGLHVDTASAHFKGQDRDRWATINEKLRSVAGALQLQEPSRYHELGTYLECLAGIEMPTGLCSTAHHRFAVLDVICTSGRGRKDPASALYLKRPEPMRTASQFSKKIAEAAMTSRTHNGAVSILLTSWFG